MKLRNQFYSAVFIGFYYLIIWSLEAIGWDTPWRSHTAWSKMFCRSYSVYVVSMINSVSWKFKQLQLTVWLWCTGYNKSETLTRETNELVTIYLFNRTIQQNNFFISCCNTMAWSITWIFRAFFTTILLEVGITRLLLNTVKSCSAGWQSFWIACSPLSFGIRTTVQYILSVFNET